MSEALLIDVLRTKGMHVRHMMLRAGLLSPRSTIITEALEMPPPPREPGQSGLSARGEALRLKGEKVWKAESRRKIRHRDGRNLRDGVGLTTGLGWSDRCDSDFYSRETRTDIIP